MAVFNFSQNQCDWHNKTMDVFRCSPKTWLEESPTVLQRSETLFGAKRIKKGWMQQIQRYCHCGLQYFLGLLLPEDKQCMTRGGSNSYNKRSEFRLPPETTNRTKDCELCRCSCGNVAWRSIGSKLYRNWWRLFQQGVIHFDQVPSDSSLDLVFHRCQKWMFEIAC